MFSVRAHAPRHRYNPSNNATHNHRVLLPVGGLCVPAAGGGPDVLGVAVCRTLLVAAIERVVEMAYGTLAPPLRSIWAALMMAAFERR